MNSLPACISLPIHIHSTDILTFRRAAKVDLRRAVVLRTVWLFRLYLLIGYSIKSLGTGLFCVCDEIHLGHILFELPLFPVAFSVNLQALHLWQLPLHQSRKVVWLSCAVWPAQNHARWSFQPLDRIWNSLAKSDNIVVISALVS